MTEAINTLRILSAEMVQRANSGHPGLPLGASPMTFTLWHEHMKHNPQNPKWMNRDRFVLSAGHGSALLYSLLHVFGYGLTIDDLKSFRQLDSLTPGHPEYNHTPGVEVTTGPLGQGIANAVGMALAERHLAAKFNTPEFNLIDHYTYALCGDGCMMEGVSCEAASLAGTLGLNKLIVLYDSNNITIEGDTSLAFAEDVRKRFEAYGWNTLLVQNGNDTIEISNAIAKAKCSDKPTLVEVKTTIGYGAPNKQGKASVHGEPLGYDEIQLMKDKLNWKYDEEFYVPDSVKEMMKAFTKKAMADEKLWNELLENYKLVNSKLADEFETWHAVSIDDSIFDDEYWSYTNDLATRLSSEEVLNKLSHRVPNLIGGSADLGPSNKSVMKSREYYSKDNPNGSNLHFGVREHAMTAISNGMALHGGLRVYVSGFFVFSDYMKPAMRLAALMNLPVIYVLTHDSIGVGEDGPTHQPIEQLAGLRSIPGFTVIRPCDTNETAAAWCYALKHNGPTAIILSRQTLPLLNETSIEAMKGAYVLRDADDAEIILIASGSEVSLVYDAYEKLNELGIKSRVISIPSFEIFERQSDEYKQSVLPNSIRKRIAVEAASDFGWHKFVGLDGKVIGINTFGASAPANLLFDKYNLTVDNVVHEVMKLKSG